MNSRFFAVAAAVLLAGCVSVEYTGDKLAPKASDSKIAVYTDSARITRPYQVLGTAKVSGNYQEVSRDRMMEKLRSEARGCGADAILIVEQQVIPGDLKVSENPVFSTSFDYDDTNSNWSQLSRDVDRNFANSNRNRTLTAAGSANNFRRVIRAEFLRYREQPASGAPRPESR